MFWKLEYFHRRELMKICPDSPGCAGVYSSETEAGSDGRAARDAADESSCRGDHLSFR